MSLYVRAFHSRPATVRRAVARPSKIFRHKLDAEPDTALIRVGGNHDFLRSPVEALALIRDVERRFGSVQAFSFKRDYDKNTRYQALMHVAFKDPAVYERLSTTPTEFTFKRPSVESNRPGGVGLEDIKPFLETRLPEQTSDSPQLPENEGSAPGENTILYTVRGCKNNLVLMSMYTKVPDVSSQTARSFLRWGGFHSLKPISSETELRIESGFRPSSIDHFRMRCALRRYSQEHDLPNPYEVPPGQELEMVPQEQRSFEVPDPVSALQDSTMLDDVLTGPKLPDSSAPSSSPTAPELDHPPSPTVSTMSSSSLSEPDTTSPSSTLESPLAQPVIPSPSPVPSPSSTGAQPSTTSSESVAQAEAIAAKMQKQAKSLDEAKKKKELKRKEMEINPLPRLSEEKPVRQASDAKRKEQEKPEKPATVSQKIRGFFSGLL